MTMPKALLAFVAIFLAVSCQKTSVRREMMAMGPVILPNEMCAEHGTTAMSNDKEGDRMVCQMENKIGTHIPNCVCFDEGFSERERELALVMMRNINSIQACGGAATCPGIGSAK
jgi:hypothetical protein